MSRIHTVDSIIRKSAIKPEGGVLDSHPSKSHRNIPISHKLTSSFLILSILLQSIAGIFLFVPKENEAKAAGNTYYVDTTVSDLNVASSAPDCVDYNPETFVCGTGDSSVFKTIADINIGSFLPDDQILFRRGQDWYEQLTVPSSGTDGHSITFGAYGSGSNPRIHRSDNNVNWYEHTNIANSDLELYTGMPDDGITDTFTNWTNIVNNGNLVEAIDSAYSGETATRITKSYQPTSNAQIRKNTISVKPNTTYYFEFYGRRVSGTGDCQSLVRDATNTMYLYEDGTWKTAATYPANLMADESEWTKKGMSFTTQGNTYSLWIDFSITYNLTAVCEWDAVYLKEGTQRSSTKIWASQISDVQRNFGITDDGARVPVESRYSTTDPLDLNEGYFFNKNTSYFYYRKDNGDLTDVEVGARPYGIKISGKNYIVIDGIDVYGPGGNSEVSSHQHQGIVINSASSHIIIKNLTISHTDSVGISVSSDSSDVSYDNIISHDNGSTGIYLSSNGGSVTNSKSYHNGNLVTDSGDRGGFGITGTGLTVSNNEAYGNGRNDGNNDFEISVVLATGPISVTNNYVHDCYEGCIQIAEGGDDSIIAYNVIDGFGSTTYTGESWGKFSGIRIGGGVTGASGVKIYNNLIANGASITSGQRSGIAVTLASSTGTIIKNNVFYNNNDSDIAINSVVDTAAHNYDNNLFYHPNETNTWNWKGVIEDSLSLWQGASGQDYNSIFSNPSFVNPASSNYNLASVSSAIDSGTPISGRTTDHLGNPIYGTPDIGAYEYQPPYSISSDDINISSPVRIYSDGKYRYTAATSGSSDADLTIQPQGGFGTGDYSAWMDITIDTWQTSDHYYKKWTEESDTHDITTIHNIGDLQPNGRYTLKVDGQGIATYIASRQGRIDFTYSGGYSAHTFEIEEDPGASFTPPSKPSISLLTITTLDNGTLSFDHLPDTITQIAISTNPTFTDASWEDIAKKEELLEQYASSKTLYIKFRTQQGGVSDIIIKKNNTIEIANESQNDTNPSTPTLNDGDIVKTPDSSDIYILKHKNNNKYKRLIIAPYIFNLYHHLRWEDIKTISQAELDQYAASNLVRETLDAIIYELSLDSDTGKKKPLDPSTQYDPDSIFEINKPEGESYGLEA